MSAESSDSGGERRRFFGGLPGTGVWTAVGLSRAQFLAILGISIAAFCFVDGPFWSVGGSHLRRLTVSYAAIPLMILVVQARHRRLDIASLAAGSVVIGLIKLVVTALLVLSLSF